MQQTHEDSGKIVSIDENIQEIEDSNEIDLIDENIQTIAELHKRAEHKVSPQQHAIENVTNFLGRPRFLFIIIIFVIIWIIVNFLLKILGLQSLDSPPFPWLQGLLTLSALLLATMILITQNRQDTMTERRMQLDLQVSLILDQKMSKLITVIDQMRQVHPELKDGTDPQVEAMKKTVDPHESVKTFEQVLENKKRK